MIFGLLCGLCIALLYALWAARRDAEMWRLRSDDLQLSLIRVLEGNRLSAPKPAERVDATDPDTDPTRRMQQMVAEDNARARKATVENGAARLVADAKAAGIYMAEDEARELAEAMLDGRDTAHLMSKFGARVQ